MDIILNERQQSERFLRFEKIERGSDGWLSPSGIFFKVGKDEHKEAADWIIKEKLSEVEDRSRPGKLPSTEFLRDKGWILLNGPILRTDNALNYTTRQLELLSEAMVPVIGVYDGSKEFSSMETLEWVNKSVDNMSGYLEQQLAMGQLYVGRWGPSGWERKKATSQDEFWQDIRDRGYSTLHEFKRNPFNTTFGDFGFESFTKFRDILTTGYQDEIIFDKGQETYTLRLIKLNSGERICVEYTFHHHDGLGSGNEEHMNVYVVDNFTFKDKIRKYVSSGISPKISGEYFRNIIENS